MDLTDSTRHVLGGLAVILSIISYIPYFRDVIKRITKPHVFSWLIWAILMSIAFLAQISEGGGPGSWVTGLGALFATSIFLISIRFGEKHITRFDWVCLVSALAAIPLWIITSDPIYSILVITAIDLIGFLPTFRKSYHAPRQETRLTWAIGGLKWTLSLAALTSFNLATALYPAALAMANGLLAVMLTVRRASEVR